MLHYPHLVDASCVPTGGTCGSSLIVYMGVEEPCSFCELLALTD